MTHIVTSALVIAKAEDGSDVYLYRGAPVPAHLDSNEVARLLEGGFIEKVNADKSEDDAPRYPDGDPDDTWKNEQIKAWAADNDRDLAGATNKADMLAAIAAPKA